MFGSFRSPDSLLMELFGLRGAWGALINTTGRLKGQLLSDILRSHAVLAVAAAQEAPGVGKDCVFFIAGDDRGEGLQQVIGRSGKAH